MHALLIAAKEPEPYIIVGHSWGGLIARLFASTYPDEVSGLVLVDPASVPFLFASLKVAVTISLIGAIVAELPTGAQAGIGARLLAGSYYGQTLQIWAALFAAAILAAVLVGIISLAERWTARWMGAKP